MKENSFSGKNFSVLIKSFICDALARAIILCIQGHSSEQYGRARCTGFSIFVGYSRTNESIREKQCVPHHHCRTIIENVLYLDIVLHGSLDPMHQLDLALMKKIIAFLFGTDSKIRNVPQVT